MAMSAEKESSDRHNARTALEPLVTDASKTAGYGLNKLALVQRLMGPFSSHKKRDSAQILSDLAPVIMTPRVINAAPPYSPQKSRASVASSSETSSSKMDFAALGRTPLRLGLGSRRITSRDLQIVEATDELLQSEVPEPDGVASNVSLLRGFNATIPSAEQGRSRRRQMRNVDAPRIGLKKLGMSARGLMMEEEETEAQSVVSEDDVVIVPRHDKKGKRRGRESLSVTKMLGKDELTRQRKEIVRDKENLHVRRSLINSEIAEITHKIEALDGIRVKLEEDLLKLQEDELELDDELEGVKERLQFEQSSSTNQKISAAASAQFPHTSRRRRGPSFLPSEHDELPPGIAFMTLDSHTSPVTALDFSEPYGTLVSCGRDDSQPLVWDLFSGTEVGRLRGHRGVVKCIQVEDNMCLTGSEDGAVRIWDLRKVGEEDIEESVEEEAEMVHLSEITEDGMIASKSRANEVNDSCTKVLEGHSKAVTALYFEGECLVTGASDKTLRQWDLTTGQCVMTMDILWAISHAHPTTPASNIFSGAAVSSGSFAVPAPPAADGSWDMYEDFVGGVQFWGYGLVSGSGDGAVRMWDMRTGQSHRTLVGHTEPVTCLQFDQLHIVSGSLDKTIRIWDLRTGGVFETLKYDFPVTSLQFDSRKVIAATGENDIKIYNRTTMQHSSLQTNGHTNPVQRLRYIDRYLVSGGRDATVKIWSL
ncbi:WD40-repeat-containing domain protein [Mycena floridula]|nr:WD40-repeat-containing domain protein [Mycena floridula]